MIIKVENLTKKFIGITAVDNISFEVEEGTIFGFLGPNGAGKTTTINILCTLLSPASGKAYIAGYDCMKESAKVRKSIGIVFQDTTLDKDLTAYENSIFHAYLYNMWRDADELVAWLAEMPPAEGIRIARLLADTKTASALRAFADKIIYDATREATYHEVSRALGQSRKQVMHAVERQHARLAS